MPARILHFLRIVCREGPALFPEVAQLQLESASPAHLVSLSIVTLNWKAHLGPQLFSGDPSAGSPTPKVCGWNELTQAKSSTPSFTADPGLGPQSLQPYHFQARCTSSGRSFLVLELPQVFLRFFSYVLSVLHTEAERRSGSHPFRCLSLQLGALLGSQRPASLSTAQPPLSPATLAVPPTAPPQVLSLQSHLSSGCTHPQTTMALASNTRSLSHCGLRTGCPGCSPCPPRNISAASVFIRTF